LKSPGCARPTGAAIPVRARPAEGPGRGVQEHSAHGGRTAALAAFALAQGWGRLPNWRSSRQFRRACLSVARDPLTIDDGLRAHLRTVKPYDLRHSYATMLYAVSGDAHAAASHSGASIDVDDRRYIAAALERRADGQSGTEFRARSCRQ
jgi:integrase